MRHFSFLDEATSSVDTRTELLIQQAMDQANSRKNIVCYCPPSVNN